MNSCPEEFSVPFTQYLLPNGRTKQVAFGVTGETAVKARSILDKGCKFEAEMLPTGMVSLSVSDGEQDIAIEVTPNGPEIPEAVVRLVEAAATAGGGGDERKSEV